MDVAAEPRFTRRDYAQLPEGFPAELIEGQLVREPAPTHWHQGVVARLMTRLQAVLGDTDRVLPGPVDVPIDEWSVLHPDVVVLSPSDAPTREAPRPTGPPLLVAEVLSPTTDARDRRVKPALYLRAGVSEVWLVDPVRGDVEVHTPRAVRRHGPEEEAVSRVVQGFDVRGRNLVADRP